MTSHTDERVWKPHRHTRRLALIALLVIFVLIGGGRLCSQPRATPSPQSLSAELDRVALELPPPNPGEGLRPSELARMTVSDQADRLARVHNMSDEEVSKLAVATVRLDDPTHPSEIPDLLGVEIIGMTARLTFPAGPTQSRYFESGSGRDVACADLCEETVALCTRYSLRAAYEMLIADTLDDLAPLFPSAGEWIDSSVVLSGFVAPYDVVAEHEARIRPLASFILLNFEARQA